MFMSVSSFSFHRLGYKMFKDEIPAAGIITGIGMVQSVPCVIIANDPTVKGGTYYPPTGQELASCINLSCVIS